MAKRMVSLLMSIVMLLSCIPFRAFAEENADVTEAALQKAMTAEETEEIHPEETEPEETLPEETEPEETLPEETEPEETLPEETEPEETLPEETEPEEALPEETEMEEALSGENGYTVPDVSDFRYATYPRTFTKTENVRVVKVDGNGEVSRYNDAETTSHTVWFWEMAVSGPDGSGSPRGNAAQYYYFSTFEELMDLSAQTYSQKTYAVFQGGSTLTITEDLVLPGNLCLDLLNGDTGACLKIAEGAVMDVADDTCEVYAAKMHIFGTYINRCYTYVEQQLSISGLLYLYADLHLANDATFNGSTKVQYEDEALAVYKTRYISSPEGLVAACKAAGDFFPVRNRILYWLNPDVEHVLQDSITLWKNVELTIFADEESPVPFVIGENSHMMVHTPFPVILDADVVVEGDLSNAGYGSTHAAVYVNKTIIFQGQKSQYSGSGNLLHLSDDPSEKLEDWIKGLDLNRFYVEEEWYSEDNVRIWLLKDLSGLTVLKEPSRLSWHKMVKYSWDEENESVKETMITRKGWVSWQMEEYSRNVAEICFYQEDGTLMERFRWEMGDTSGLSRFSLDQFMFMEPESGTYYFTVQAIGDSFSSWSSKVVKSGLFHYKKPSKTLGVCTNLGWDWPLPNWKKPANHTGNYQLEYYYASAPGEELTCIGSFSQFGDNELPQVPEAAIKRDKYGCYYYRVRALSADMTVRNSGPWSELSPAYDGDIRLETAKHRMMSLPTKGSIEEIRDAAADAVFDLGKDDVRYALGRDQSGELIAYLKKVEKAAGGPSVVEIENWDYPFASYDIRVVGGNLNYAKYFDESENTLVVKAPQKLYDLDRIYDDSAAVRFFLTLDNARKPKLFDVPVAITMQVPENIAPEHLVILTYNYLKECEVLTLEDIQLSYQNNRTYVTFALGGESDIIITHLADITVDEGTVGDLHWAVTSRGKLILSGQGSTGSYQTANAPWTNYKADIRSMIIGQDVDQIGYGTFADLDMLTELVIPQGIADISEGAILDCDNLQRISCTGDNGSYRSVDGILFRKPEGNDQGLVLHTYPAGRPEKVYVVENGVTAIGGYAFAGARNLTQVQLPGNLTTIESNAFADSGLQTITIPADVSGIGSAAFENCKDLKTIYFRGDPPVLGQGVFDGVRANAYYPANREKWTEEVFASYGDGLNWLPSDCVRIIGKTEVTAGESVILTASVIPEGTGGKISWSLAEGDEEYIKLTVSGNTATVTALGVTEIHTVTLTASAGESVVPAKQEITVYPQVMELKLYHVWTDENGEEKREDLSRYEWWYWTVEEDNAEAFAMQLLGEFWPEGSNGEFIWSSSNAKVATIEQDGTVTFTGKTGSVIFTLTTDNGVKDSVTFKVINSTWNVEAVGETRLDLMGGKSTTLKIRDADTGKSINGKNVQWSVWMEQGDVSAYASINSSGKLTTKKVQEPVTIYAYADVIRDGIYINYVEYEINLYPATTSVEILDWDGNLVSGSTVLFDLNTMEQLGMGGKALPLDSMPVQLDWTSTDRTNAYAHYTYEVAETEAGLFSALVIHSPTGKAGTVKHTFKAVDGSNKSATVTVQFGRFAQYITIGQLPEVLEEGKSFNLSAEAFPENITKKGVVWSLADPADKAYVSVSGSKVTAKKVYDIHEVTLIATSKDGQASESCTITVVPKDPQPLVICDSNSGENLTKTTVYVDLNNADCSITLSAKNLFSGVHEDVKWTVSGSTAEYEQTWSGDLRILMKNAGTVTVTAKEGKRSAAVTIKAAKMAQSIDITTKNGRAPVVAFGKTLELKAKVNGASTNKVTWSVVSGGDYASINGSGKLTARKNSSIGAYATVRATAADGSGVYRDIDVVIKPLATGIMVYTLEEDLNQRTVSLYSNGWRNNRSNTTMVWDMMADSGFRIYSTVYPYFEEWGSDSAIQDVTWKSSSAKVATVDTEGNVTFKGAGTTTITCTAADGSGQKISFKLTVVKRIQSISLPETHVVGGKNITLKPVFEPADSTNKKLYWNIYGDTAFAKIDQKGKLTTKKVTAPKTVWVQAFAQDGSGVYAEAKVTIWPKAVSKVEMLSLGNVVTGETITADVGQVVWLYTSVEPYGKACQEVNWKSSNPGVASVDEDGKITIHKAGKTVTITATAADGSGKKATVKIKTTK